MLRPAHGGGRIHRNHLAGDEPIEQHAHRGELLLHTRRPVFLLKLVDPCGDIEGTDGGEREATLLALSEETSQARA
jgi:hypothetical protein